MPWKREPVSMRLVPRTRGEVAVAICGCQSGPINPSPMSYSSALLRGPMRPCPPATSTLPLGSNVAVCDARAVVRLPVAVHVPLAGSYSSALVSVAAGIVRSSCYQHFAVGQQRRRVPRRAVVRLPVALQVPLAGSYSSALLIESPLPSLPPATSTLPLGSNVAV